MPNIKELSLMKDQERYLFRYESGHEEELLDTIVDMANDRGNEFDWFDAAVLSFQLSKQLVEEADQLLCPPDSQRNRTDANSNSPWNFS